MVRIVKDELDLQRLDGHDDITGVHDSDAHVFMPNTLYADLVDYVQNVRNGSLLIAGPTSSGKTTLLNDLLSTITDRSIYAHDTYSTDELNIDSNRNPKSVAISRVGSYKHIGKYVVENGIDVFAVDEIHDSYSASDFADISGFGSAFAIGTMHAMRETVVGKWGQLSYDSASKGYPKVIVNLEKDADSNVRRVRSVIRLTSYDNPFDNPNDKYMLAWKYNGKDYRFFQPLRENGRQDTSKD